jgi:tetratricopeptide (TPR) repeat protein
VVPEGCSADVNLRATANAVGESIVKHTTVCPLLQQVHKEDDELFEAKMVASGAERTAEAYFELAKRAADRGQVDKAIAAYNQAIRINPEYANAYNNLGSALLSKGDLDAAIAAFREAIRIDPLSMPKRKQPRQYAQVQGRFGCGHRCVQPGNQDQPRVCGCVWGWWPCGGNSGGRGQLGGIQLTLSLPPHRVFVLFSEANNEKVLFVFIDDWKYLFF